MAEIMPYSALRFTPKAGNIKELCCPPYDIISAEQKNNYIKTNGNNIIRLELPGTDSSDYETAKNTLQSWIDSGVLAKDGSPAIYVYSEKFTVKGKEYAFKGFTCRVKLHEFSEGVVLPHEETLSKAKADRFNLMCATGCNFSQVYSLYRDEKGETAELLAKATSRTPDIEFCDDDNVTHSLWIVNDAETLKIVTKQFENRKLYIADGHHRYETALNYRRHLKDSGISCPDADYVMMFLADLADPGLVVFPTHRIVHDVKDFNEQDMLKTVGRDFSITDCKPDEFEALLSAEYEKGSKAFGYISKTACKLLVLKDIATADRKSPEKSEALRRLDVTVLHSLILEDCFKIDRANMANGANLTYTRDIDEAVGSIKDDNVNCAFILNPTRVTEISDVACAGEKMPQKSTYFYPKLITGLVMNKIL